MFDPDNLLSLCRQCYLDLHDKRTPEMKEWSNYVRSQNA